MTDFGHINHALPTIGVQTEHARNGVHRPIEEVAAPAPAKATDQVELSDRARLLSRLLDQETDIRPGLVERVRFELNAGTYETPDKIDRAVDAIITDFEAIG